MNSLILNLHGVLTQPPMNESSVGSYPLSSVGRTDATSNTAIEFSRSMGRKSSVDDWEIDESLPRDCSISTNNSVREP